MKKHRIVKITVKTREFISSSNDGKSAAASDVTNSVCPVCQTVLTSILPAAESSDGATKIEKPAELPAAEVSEKKESENKGVL